MAGCQKVFSSYLSHGLKLLSVNITNVSMHDNTGNSKNKVLPSSVYLANKKHEQNILNRVFFLLQKRSMHSFFLRFIFSIRLKMKKKGREGIALSPFNVRSKVSYFFSSLTSS